MEGAAGLVVLSLVYAVAQVSLRAAVTEKRAIDGADGLIYRRRKPEPGPLLTH